MKIELRGLSERLSTVETNQTTVAGGVNSLQTSIVQAATVTNTLVNATKTIQGELTKAQEGLIQIQTNAEAREHLERASAESIDRLEAIIAGTQSKGTAGMEGFDYDRARKELRIPDEFQVEAMAAVGRPGPKELLPEELLRAVRPGSSHDNALGFGKRF